MKNAENELVLEIMSMCLEYNCDTLTMFCSYHAHVDGLQVSVFQGGWRENADSSYQASTYLKAPKANKLLIRVIGELKQIKEEHDTLYAPEYIESTREQERLDKIASLQQQIEELS